MKMFEKLEELERRISTLKSAVTTIPLLDVEEDELQSAINDANMVRKLGYQVENELKAAYLKQFGEIWDPDTVWSKPAVFDIPTPTAEDIKKMEAADIVFDDPKTQEEIERFLREDK